MTSPLSTPAGRQAQPRSDSSPPIVWLDDRVALDAAIAGGKGANLAELVRAGFRVPTGFVVTANAYLTAIDEAGIRVSLREKSAAALEIESDLAVRATELQELVRGADLPQWLGHDVAQAYRKLGEHSFVAVRSSATSEDSSTASFAGMNESFTNVRGQAELLARVQDCWASLFSERACAYRASRGLLEEPVIAVVVQQMVNADRSGVMFTADPSTGDRSHIVIEAAYGLGEVVVGGEVEPDTYIVDKAGPTVVSTRIGRKPFADRARVSRPRPARRVRAGDVAAPCARRRRGARVGAPGDEGRRALPGATGHGMDDGRRRDLARPVASHHDARRPAVIAAVAAVAPLGRDLQSGPGTRLFTRRRQRSRAHTALRARERELRRRRRARRGHDEPGLGAGHAQGRRGRHRRRRHHLPRGDPQPGARRPVHRRHRRGHHQAPRRHGGHRRRRAGRRVRRREHVVAGRGRPGGLRTGRHRARERTARHPSLRESGDARPGGAGRGHGRRRRRPAAGGVHAHRRPRRRPTRGDSWPRAASASSSSACRRRCCGSPAPSRRGRSCTGPPTSGATSSGTSPVVRSTNPRKRTR